MNLDSATMAPHSSQSQQHARRNVASPSFVISLDLELLWGFRDKQTSPPYYSNILGVREAVPAILDCFVNKGVVATWATVGLLLFETKQDLLEHLPLKRPRYLRQELNPYADLDNIGDCERSDPYHFGLSLVRQIAAHEGMELASQTFSHYYCLEAGQSAEEFDADLEASIYAIERVAQRPTSIVFPRNQCNHDYLKHCAARGFTAFRGNPLGWATKPSTKAQQSHLRRAARLADSYLNISRDNGFVPQEISGMVNIPASVLLRPTNLKLRLLEPLRIKRIKDAMTSAARSGRSFHLWWHPENFGVNLRENIAALVEVLSHHVYLREKYGVASRTMREIAVNFTACEMSSEREVDAGRSLAVNQTSGEQDGTDDIEAGDPQSVANVYFRKNASYWADIYQQSGIIPRITQERLRMALAMVERLRLWPAPRALDVGCGAGIATVGLACRGFAVDALDPIQVMVDATRNRAIEAGVDSRVATRIGDVQALPFPDDSFDLVLALGVLPWVPQVEKALREMSRVLRPGGYMVASVDARWQLRQLFLNPPLRWARRLAARVMGRGGSRSGVTSLRAFRRAFNSEGLEELEAAAFGFGPFTILRLEILPGSVGLKLHNWLQSLANLGTPILRSTGSQYLFLMKKRSCKSID